MMSEKKSKPRYVVCVHDDKRNPSLQPRRIYRVVPDPRAARDGMIRVIDEEQEDYLYPANWFRPVELTAETAAAVEAA